MSLPAPGRFDLASLPPTQQGLLNAIKQHGPQTTRELAGRLGVTYEAARQQLNLLAGEGWLRSGLDRSLRTGAGRPSSTYTLTSRGEHLYPKSYDELAVELIDALAEQLGPAAVKQVLHKLAAARVEHWRPRLEGKTLREKLEALRSLYLADDPFAAVEVAADGGLRLIERNCPFLAIASRRPAVCSVSVSVLSRLLGCRVVREERFQRGDGRCVFKVLAEEPLPAEAPGFEWEADQ